MDNLLKNKKGYPILLDTCSIIDLFHKSETRIFMYYQHEIINKISILSQNNTLQISSVTLEELHDPEMKKEVKEIFKSNILKHDDKVQKQANNYYSNLDIASKPRRNGTSLLNDIYNCFLAEKHNAVFCSSEKYALDKKSLKKIPGMCKELGIKFLSIHELVYKLGDYK